MNHTTQGHELYSKEELEFFRNVENRNYTPLPQDEFEKEKAKAKLAAQNTIEKMTKRKSLNIRIIESDIPSIKALALQEGVPYQTLLTSIIHKVATGKIKL